MTTGCPRNFERSTRPPFSAGSSIAGARFAIAIAVDCADAVVEPIVSMSDSAPVRARNGVCNSRKRGASQSRPH